jgi:hypothetical protein
MTVSLMFYGNATCKIPGESLIVRRALPKSYCMKVWQEVDFLLVYLG